MHRSQVLVRVVLGIALALGATACGGADDKNGGGGGAVSQSAQDEAKAAVEEYSKPIDSLPISEPLAKLPTGKKFLLMRCASPVCRVIGDAFEEAVKALGATPVVLDVGTTPQELADAWDQATNMDDVAAIYFGSYPPSLFEAPLKELTDRGVKVVSSGVGVAEWPGIGVQIWPPAYWERVGKLMADYIIADLGGATETLFVNKTDVTVFKSEYQGYENELKKLCADCSIGNVDVVTADLAKTGFIAGRVVSYVQAHPDTKYVVGAYGDMFNGVPQALKAAGFDDVKLISTNGGSLNFDYILSGQGQVADVGSPNAMVGWIAADQLARMVGGQEAATMDEQVDLVPNRFLTKDTIDFDPNAGSWPGVTDYQDAFKKLWGVS